MNRTFWEKKRVFVTGHTGFKGSWLSLWLQMAGAKVTGYALQPPTEPNLFRLAGVAGGMTSLEGDIRDFQKLRSAIESARPEVVLHLAAQSVVKTSYENPVETYETNVMGTVHVLEAVRGLGGPCLIVNVTSDKCYENKEWLWGYREDEPMGGHDPYSNSKGCAELVASAYQRSFFPVEDLSRHGIALASVRAGNVIGGGDWTPHQLVPDIIRSFAKGEPVRIRSPKAVRPWQFVLEPINGYLMVAEHLAAGPTSGSNAWNFGPDDRDVRPVQWIVNEMAKRWGEGARWSLDAGPHPHEAHLLKLDSSKARALLSWAPRLPLSGALDWVVEWYKVREARGDVRQSTLAQIARFEELDRQGAGTE